MITDHIFCFNLRAYDRINVTPALLEQEQKSGIKYKELQRAEAEEIMGSGIHGYTEGEQSDDEAQTSKIDDDKRREIIDRKRKFEAAREHLEKNDPVNSEDSIAEDAMTGGGLVSEEHWQGEPEDEKEHFVQEELYIHASKFSPSPCEARADFAQRS